MQTNFLWNTPSRRAEKIPAQLAPVIVVIRSDEQADSWADWAPNFQLQLAALIGPIRQELVEGCNVRNFDRGFGDDDDRQRVEHAC